jgi:hypothetical protein
VAVGKALQDINRKLEFLNVLGSFKDVWIGTLIRKEIVWIMIGIRGF